jgi:hypothetical protein
MIVVSTAKIKTLDNVRRNHIKPVTNSELIVSLVVGNNFFRNNSFKHRKIIPKQIRKIKVIKFQSSMNLVVVLILIHAFEMLRA